MALPKYLNDSGRGLICKSQNVWDDAIEHFVWTQVCFMLEIQCKEQCYVIKDAEMKNLGQI